MNTRKAAAACLISASMVSVTATSASANAAEYAGHGTPTAQASTISDSTRDSRATPTASKGWPKKVKAVGKKRVMIDRMRKRKGLDNLPSPILYVYIKKNGSGATKDYSSAQDVSAQDWGFDPGFFGDTWQVAKCSASIVIAIAPVAKGLKVVKELGGAKETAELIVKAGSLSDLKKAVGPVAFEVLGIAAIEANCF